MNNEFCTITNANYLPRALVLYRSLVEACPEFCLRILCMDERTKRVIDAMSLPNAIPIALSELEQYDSEYRAVKDQRSEVEYSWTAIPTVCRFVFEREPDLRMLTRLDCDLMFFRDPAPLFEELGDDSVLIIPHRFSPKFRGWEAGGVFNTQFETFRRDERGMAALDWWRERCIEWCYDKVEDTRWGDQKYLDDWPQRFAGIHILEHLGGGLAPWNSEQYALECRERSLYVDGQPVVFYHYQSLELCWGMTMLRRLGVGSETYRCASGREPLVWRIRAEYRLSEKEETWIWRPYVERIGQAITDIRVVDASFPVEFTTVGPLAFVASGVRKVLPSRIRKRLRKAVSTVQGRRLNPTTPDRIRQNSGTP